MLLFYDILNFLKGIYDSLMTLGRECINFMSNTLTIGNVELSFGVIAFGYGLFVWILFIAIKNAVSIT